MSGLVLSLFSGMGVLDEGFRRAGYCVVSAGDVAWSSLYDVRGFHPPAGVFEGVIGGDPCQSHSSLANLVRAKGLEPTFPDLTGELVRVIEEARPRWFLRENVPRAPDAKPAGYDVRSFLLDHSHLDRGDGTGHEQMRRRRFWFGVRDGECPDLRRWIDFALTVLPDLELAQQSGPAGPNTRDAKRLGGPGGTAVRADRKRVQAIAGDSRAVPVALGGSGKRKATVQQRGSCGDVTKAWLERKRAATGRHEGAVGSPEKRKATASCDGRQGHRIPDGTGQFRQAAATGRHDEAIGETGGHKGNAPRYSLAEMLHLQGIPEDVFQWSPLTMQGKRKFVGNAVPLPMAEQLGRAVKAAMADREAAA